MDYSVGSYVDFQYEKTEQHENVFMFRCNTIDYDIV